MDPICCYSIIIDKCIYHGLTVSFKSLVRGYTKQLVHSNKIINVAYPTEYDKTITTRTHENNNSMVTWNNSNSRNVADM